MNILVLNEDTTQAKLVLKHDTAIVKIPNDLPEEMQLELRNKLLRVADLNKKNRKFSKLYYRPGTPYLFLNRKLGGGKKETVAVYKYADL